jgi:hypothetical protein
MLVLRLRDYDTRVPHITVGTGDGDGSMFQQPQSCQEADQRLDSSEVRHQILGSLSLSCV